MQKYFHPLHICHRDFNCGPAQLTTDPRFSFVQENAWEEQAKLLVVFWLNWSIDLFRFVSHTYITEQT